MTAVCFCVIASGCSNSDPEDSGMSSDSTSSASSTTLPDTSESGTSTPIDLVNDEIKTKLSKIDMSAWQYNSDDDVYYQTGIPYCENPADAELETLAVFVPGEYMIGTENGDGTYTCELSAETVNGYTALNAPIVIPINTPGYSEMSSLRGYSSQAATYTNEGFIYAYAGCRGRDDGAPAGVTDLKAAVRYLRYCGDIIPGNTERIFTFGMSGGGAQSALMGATGDSELYTPYLQQIGAVEGVSDSICGSMDWCPITNLDTADESYEWMMGSTRSDLSDDEKAISDALATAWAEYVNSAEIKDENGNVLVLTKSAEGIYQEGSYYDYIKGVIEQSLSNFLSDTEFPYNASKTSGGGMHGGNMPEGERPGGNNKPDGNFPEGGFPGGAFPGDRPDGQNDDTKPFRIEDEDNIVRNEITGGISLNGTYETARDYVSALNENGAWVTYNESTNTVEITSISDFVSAFKRASKKIGAFDQLDGGQGENTLFGYGDGSGAHFDGILGNLLAELGSEYAESYRSDLGKTDSMGYTVEQRVNMYTPMYYLLGSSDGYGSSTVAKYWRIRSGINQSDTALTTEVNLALALENYDGVESVDFAAVWGAGHVEAERTGSSTENFIDWVNDCLKTGS